MARITLRQLLDHAAEHGYGVPAFNIDNMEQGLAIMEAARALDAPVILQASGPMRSSAGESVFSRIIDAFVSMYPAIPVCVHRNHGETEATCAAALKAGFTSVMMDGSLRPDGLTPADYAYNITVTKAVADLAHEFGASVEGALGRLGPPSATDPAIPHEEDLTDPGQAADFVAATGVDALAVSIGARHGALQAPRAPQGTILAFDLLETIHLKLPSTHLVLHGSASLPQALQDQFVAFGGELPKTWGVPLEELQRSIGLGVRKINVDADCRLAMAVAFRRVAAQDRAAADPRKFIRPAMDAMHKVCRERIEAFGAAGRASAIKVTPLGEMAARYRSGAQGAAA